MTDSEMHILKNQWCAVNGFDGETAGMGKNFRLSFFKDNGKLIVKYVSKCKDKSKCADEGIQFIISYDYETDLYNVVVEKYRNNEIIASREINGLYEDGLSASILADFDGEQEEFEELTKDVSEVSRWLIERFTDQDGKYKNLGIFHGPQENFEFIKKVIGTYQDTKDGFYSSFRYTQLDDNEQVDFS